MVNDIHTYSYIVYYYISSYMMGRGYTLWSLTVSLFWYTHHSSLRCTLAWSANVGYRNNNIVVFTMFPMQIYVFFVHVLWPCLIFGHSFIPSSTRGVTKLIRGLRIWRLTWGLTLERNPISASTRGVERHSPMHLTVPSTWIELTLMRLALRACCLYSHYTILSTLFNCQL